MLDIKIKACKNVYTPREDSYMLAKAVEKYAFGKALDIGTGSGIQGIVAAKKNCKVTFSDLQESALSCAKYNAKLNGVKGKFIKSDMFCNIGSRFDTIIFNPPYLPSIPLSKKNIDITIDGGRKGRELIDRFFHSYDKFLKPKGLALLVESSFNDYMDDVKSKQAKIIEKEHYFFEDLVVLLIKKI